MHQEQTTLTLVHFDQYTKSRQIRLSCCVFLVLQSGLPPGHQGEVWVHWECTASSHPLPCTDTHPAIHQAIHSSIHIDIYVNVRKKKKHHFFIPQVLKQTHHTSKGETNTSYQQRWNKQIIPVKVKQTHHTSEGETNTSYQRRWNKHFIPAEVKQTHHTSRNKMLSLRVKQTHHTSRDKTTSPTVTHHITKGETNTSYHQRWNKHIIPPKVKQTHHISRDKTAPMKQTHRTSRNKTAPMKQTHHTSRDKTAPRVKQTHRTSRDKTAPMKQTHHTSRDKTTSTQAKTNTSHQQEIKSSYQPGWNNTAVKHSQYTAETERVKQNTQTTNYEHRPCTVKYTSATLHNKEVN